MTGTIDHLKKQRGVAIITALLVVMLAASIAAFLLSQQSHALTRTVRATDRAQAALYAKPTLDWARAMVFDMQKKSTRVDLTQPWTQGLIAVPIDGATASGSLRDDAGLFNINNLLKEDGTRSEPDTAIFRRLLTSLKLNPDLAHAVLDWIDADDDVTFPGGAESAAYMAAPGPTRAANQRLVQLEELHRVAGFNAELLGRLRPFVTVLPTRSKVNINTAPAEVLAALLPDLAVEEISALVKLRLSKPFAQIDGNGGLKEYLSKTPPALIEQSLDVKSGYFSVYLAIDNNGAQVRQSALLQRRDLGGGGNDKWPSIIWVRND